MVQVKAEDQLVQRLRHQVQVCSSLSRFPPSCVCCPQLAILTLSGPPLSACPQLLQILKLENSELKRQLAEARGLPMEMGAAGGDNRYGVQFAFKNGCPRLTQQGQQQCCPQRKERARGAVAAPQPRPFPCWTRYLRRRWLHFDCPAPATHPCRTARRRRPCRPHPGRQPAPHPGCWRWLRIVQPHPVRPAHAYPRPTERQGVARAERELDGRRLRRPTAPRPKPCVGVPGREPAAAPGERSHAAVAGDC